MAVDFTVLDSSGREAGGFLAQELRTVADDTRDSLFTFETCFGCSLLGLLWRRLWVVLEVLAGRPVEVLWFSLRASPRSALSLAWIASLPLGLRKSSFPRKDLLWPFNTCPLETFFPGVVLFFRCEDGQEVELWL